MNKKKNIEELIDAALNSFDAVEQAEAKPFLLTRINARMNRKTESVWEKAGWFIGRPAVAFTGLCLIVLINAMVLVSNKQSGNVNSTDQVVQNQADEFSYTVATIYDFENAQPNDEASK